MTDKDISPSPSFQRFKPYPSYKDSGVEWLGKIPTTWRSVRLRYVAIINPTKSEIHALDPALSVSFVPMEALGESGGLNLEVMRPLGMLTEGYTYFRDNDVVVAKITPCFENGKGALAQGLLNGLALGTTELHVLRPRSDVDPRFLFYLTFSDHFRRLGAAEMYGAAGQKRVPEDFILNFRHPLPGLENQRLISDFLDRETAKIDALIAKKERLIKLLQEKRTALITQAVTKGLDPNVPMKDSDVEWLGKIPTHWEVKMLKRLAIMRAGTAITSKEIESVGEYPVFGGNGIRGYTGSFTHDGAYPLIGRQGALCGCVNFAFGKFWASEHAVVVAPNAPVDAIWLTNLLQAMSLNSYSQSAAQPGLAVETIGMLRAPLPGIDEQRIIAAFLDGETAKIDSLVIKIKEAIDRLKEYRIALIAAAVTGKIDVRIDAAQTHDAR